ncbi:hypothetical protein JVU11DRAFT_6176 [Chiua virens]|nr:hypothetical protein JVU11DRAFT_6176 [Chiua virens]
MPQGNGSRFVSVAEDVLRRKISTMEERMHLLEDALAIIQLDSEGSASLEPLPPINEEGPSEGARTPEVVQDSMRDDFNKYGLFGVLGSLHLHDGPPSDPAFTGTSGDSESLLLQAKAFLVESASPANHAEEIDPSYFPSEIQRCYQTFPFTPSGISTEPIQDLIESYLPSSPRSTKLCEIALQTLPWIVFNIVSREHILNELLPTVYERARGQTPARWQPKPYGPHDIALLFIVFAIGASLDLSLPPYNAEGRHYYVLSRAALCLQPVFAQCSIVTIKTLNLMSIYNGMCGIESKLEDSHSLLKLATQLALKIGLHKDPSVWGIIGGDAYERRTCFWNISNAAMWQSLITGHPPVIIPSWIDCLTPTEEEENKYQLDGVPLGFGTWYFSFVSECLIPVVEVIQVVHPPSYDVVLALDGKIREFLPPQPPSGGSVAEQTQAIMRSQIREFTLLLLHRGFFAQALADYPQDPFASPYQQSILTAYQSATKILHMTGKQFSNWSALSARVWRLWSLAFSAAITIGIVAIKRLSAKLEPEPIGQLDLACTLFREAARASARAQKALPILLRLRQEAMTTGSKFAVADQIPYVGTVGVPPEWQGPSGETSSAQGFRHRGPG